MNTNSYHISPVFTVEHVKSINNSTKNSRYSSKSRRPHYTHSEIQQQPVNIIHPTKGNGSIGYMTKKVASDKIIYATDKDMTKAKAMLNRIFPNSQSHSKNMTNLSNLNWRKRIENLT